MIFNVYSSIVPLHFYTRSIRYKWRDVERRLHGRTRKTRQREIFKQRGKANATTTLPDQVANHSTPLIVHLARFHVLVRVVTCRCALSRAGARCHVQVRVTHPCTSVKGSWFDRFPQRQTERSPKASWCLLTKFEGGRKQILVVWTFWVR